MYMSDLPILAVFRLQLNWSTSCCRDRFFKELHRTKEAVVQEKELIINNDA